MVRATFAVLGMLCISWAAAEQLDTLPPRPLHKVDDHWTPYDPPKDFAADANVYIIQKGDTLWALAKKNLGNPYLWPQLWEKNKYIRDAHWIYPGDPLVVGVKAAEVSPPAPTAPPAAPTPPAAQPAPPATTGEAGAGAEGAGKGPGGEVPAGTLVAAGSEDDIYCFAYLDDKNARPQLTIASAEDIEYTFGFSTNDIVYLSGGEAEGVKAGQEYFIVQPVRKLHHPATDAILGTVIRYLGRARVLCTQDHAATAEILSSCDSIPIGTWLKPYEPIPIPMTLVTKPVERCDPSSTKAKGYIVYTKDDTVTVGQDHVAMIDLGEADQVSPGSQAIVYRDNPVAGAPRILLGEVAVLTTSNHWATVKIIRSQSPMRVGDRVELK
ncbi:MAG: LysM peptidoglycan-binding domain-containing protein [Acidobacteriia bacterium]|nr:LysM peptidoglycan-binding domain-containing protein [Terriglobia bacterium]